MRTSTAGVLLLVVAACGQSQPTTTTTRTELPPAVVGPGRIETRSFPAPSLGVDKDYVIYLPAGYDDLPDQRWPVFYYLHGLTGNETNWTEGGDLAATADRLGLRAIVVMPDGDDSFYTDAVADYDYQQCVDSGVGLFVPTGEKWKSCVKTRRYETYIVDDLVHHIDATYRTIAARDGRGIAGLSMGGFGALQLAMRHKDLFAATVSHSGVDSLFYRGPHPFVPGKAELMLDPEQWGRDIGWLGTYVRGIFGPDVANWKAHDPTTLVASLQPGELAIYLDCGTEDDFELDDGASYLHELLDARGIEHEFFLGPGKHDMGFWKARLPESLRFLAGHVAAPRAR